LTVPNPIPILVGPTGVGKTDVAFLLALAQDAEIISADAFQVYRGLPVGTAQPEAAYLKRVPHHLIGVRDAADPWNAVLFAEEARRLIDDLESRGKKVLLVGGAGFYVQTLIEGSPEGGPPTPDERQRVLSEVLRKGPGPSWTWLKGLDPAAASRIHENDQKRICRALEKVLYPKPALSTFQPLGNSRVRVIGLEKPREKLDLLLKLRAQGMWESGLLEETAGLLERKLPDSAPIWGAIGYAEAAAFLKKSATREEALDLMFIRTRQYAKRQWTWFKHHPPTRWHSVETAERTVRELQQENLWEEK